MDYTTWKNTIFNKLSFGEKLKLLNEYLSRVEDSHIYNFDMEDVNKCFCTPYHLAMSLTINKKTDEFFLVDSEGDARTISAEQVSSMIEENLRDIYIATYNNVRVIAFLRSIYDKEWLDSKTQKEISEIALADANSRIWGSLQEYADEINNPENCNYGAVVSSKYWVYFIDF